MIYTSCSGYCPRYDTTRSLTIEYEEVLMSGGRKPGYKKMDFDCPDVNGCSHLDKYNRCPIFLSAPDNPNL